MSQLNLNISPGQVIWPRVVLVLGLSICFAPANVAAYLYTPPLLRGAAVGLLSLLRNEGGSVGTSMAQTVQERREQFHTPAARRVSRSPQSCRAFLHRAGAARFSSRPEIRPRQRSAWRGAGEPAPAASLVIGLFRLFLALRRRGVRGGVLRLVDEAFRRRKVRPSAASKPILFCPAPHMCRRSKSPSQRLRLHPPTFEPIRARDRPSIAPDFVTAVERDHGAGDKRSRTGRRGTDRIGHIAHVAEAATRSVWATLRALPANRRSCLRRR